MTAKKASARREPLLDDLVVSQRALLPEIHARVRARYLPTLPTLRRDPEPLDGLIETILSQQNTAPITRRQFAALKSAFGSWEQALVAGPDAIEDVLKTAGGGLSRVKADYIWNVVHTLSERGDVTLRDLHALSDEEARARLESLPGVGPKTASCVMIFELVRPAMPVDTHLHRISKRLMLVPATWSAPRTEAWYASALANTWAAKYGYHVSMIRHGRETCTAQRPKCAACVLRDLCPSAELFLSIT
ncbi:endonuclease III domain-containing protein [Deinococcus yavapaiensis]|uniref:Endonuclease-3 n=1 Tax=Deinococcus yavapaiensis KR-236 TaxID=694435 RepID=A0A318S6L4_9DEIO|nr:endonuclease III [Deinococcus yavapaiensis]PYE53357.1 endonuclease-3 [Deinococcus yavapaiensis KR-236]